MTDCAPRSSLKRLLASGEIPFVASPGFAAFNSTQLSYHQGLQGQEKKYPAVLLFWTYPLQKLFLTFRFQRVYFTRGLYAVTVSGRYPRKDRPEGWSQGNYHQTKIMLNEWTWLKIFWQLKNIFSVELIQIQHSGSLYRVQVYHMADHFSKTAIHWKKTKHKQLHGQFVNWF